MSFLPAQKTGVAGAPYTTNGSFVKPLPEDICKLVQWAVEFSLLLKTSSQLLTGEHNLLLCLDTWIRQAVQCDLEGWP